MKTFLVLILFLGLSWMVHAQSKPSLHGLTANSTDGKKVLLKNYAGKKLLIVNTASYCQYTYQYGALQLLYSNFKSYDFEILAFPSNDFGGQDPYSDSVIHTFCTGNYNITFPLMAKVNVATGDTSPVYRWLQEKRRNGVKDVSVAWNFGKFLINESGEWVRYLPSDVSPTDTSIVHWILSPSSTLGLADSKALPYGIELLSVNPVTNVVAIRSHLAADERCSIELHSIEGKPIQSQKNVILPTGNTDYLYDVSGVSPGMYFLSISNGSDQLVFKLLIAPY